MLTGPKNPLFSSAATVTRTRPDQSVPAPAAAAETEKVPERIRGGSEKKEDDEPTLIETIREKGMQAYVEELREKKKKALREAILRQMGLSEDALKKMSPEVRAEIEKIVNKEVAKRMQAEGELDRQQKGQLGPDPTPESGTLNQLSEQIKFAQIDDAGVGLGPLLALQEADLRDNPEPSRKDDEAGK